MKDRSDHPSDIEARQGRWLSVVYELLNQAQEADHAGDAAFKTRRLDEADRVLRRLPDLKEVNRARQRSERLRRGVAPKTSQGKRGGRRAALRVASPRVIDPAAAEAAKRSQKLKQQERAATQKRVLEERLRQSRCHECGAPGVQVKLKMTSGRPPCASCHARWTKRICAKCGAAFKRSAADSRARNCPSCRPGKRELYTVPAGLPSLGRRRKREFDSRYRQT